MLIFNTVKVQTRVHTSVSNGKGRCNFSGQRDRSSFIVPGQRDNGTSSKSCYGTGRDFLQAVPSRPRTFQDTITFNFVHKMHYFFPMISCFRTSFPVLECTFPVLERPFLF
jgi:hypothetical protein